MPPDLEEFYHHMLSSIDPSEIEEGSRIFRMYWSIIEGAPGNPGSEQADMEVIYRSLIGTYLHSIRIPIPDAHSGGASGREEAGIILFTIELILQTRCGGLLEIQLLQHPTRGKVGSLVPIHRTVYDFLKTPEVRDIVQRHSLQTDPLWDPHLALCVGAILRLKNRSCFTCTADQNKQRIWSLWQEFAANIKEVQRSARLCLADIILAMDEFDKSACSSNSGYSWYQRQAAGRPSSDLTFISVAEEAGLLFYLVYKHKK